MEEPLHRTGPHIQSTLPLSYFRVLRCEKSKPPEQFLRGIALPGRLLPQMTGTRHRIKARKEVSTGNADGTVARSGSGPPRRRRLSLRVG